MSELTRMRRAFDSIEGPTGEAVSIAREMLRREIDAFDSQRPSRSRRLVLVATAAAILVAGLLVTPAFGLGSRLLDLFHDSPGHSIDLTMTGSVSPSTGGVRGKVRIDCEGTLTGPQGAGSGRGRFILSGAISDRGTFVDGGFHGFHHETDPHIRTLFGAKGTIRIAIDAALGNVVYWRIITGTKAYAGLRGRGQERGLYGPRLT